MEYVRVFVCFKQKSASEMRISDWSSDVCSSDLRQEVRRFDRDEVGVGFARRRLGQQGLAGSGWAIKQKALGRSNSKAPERRGIFQRQFDPFDQLVARGVEAADVAPAQIGRAHV